jgi:tetratricopeptide (TPR) repeat protein
MCTRKILIALQIEKRVFVLSAFAFLFFAGTPALSQTKNPKPNSVLAPSTETAPAAPTAVPLVPKTTSSPNISEQVLQFQIASLKEQIKSLEEKTTNYLLLMGTVFAAVFAFFGVIPFITGKAAERRAQESHNLAIESHNLAIRGEVGSQERAAQVHQTFLAESKNTLELVNATLRLAKDASERAATIIQARAEKLLKDLDRTAKKMLSEAKDDRDLVTHPKKRSDLLSLANKIQGFEINSFMFPSDLPLTPECLYIRGMDFHLKQQFDDAFEAWLSVALDENAVPPLRSLAWFWIGYEQNNLGLFSEAEKSFENAERFEAGIRKFELQRIRLETRFFNRTLGPARNSVGAFENLLRSFDGIAESDEIRGHLARAWTTFGNILVETGREETDKGEAEKLFKRAQSAFAQVSDQSPWALFGLGQSFAYLGQNAEAEEILAGKARKNAQAEYINRVEPRTKVLARTTEIICCALVEGLKKDVHSVYGDLIEAIGLVDHRLTIYSQFQKRNVSREEFRSDLDKFVAEYELAKYL